MIQAEVAKQLVSSLKEKYYSTVIDVGCGSGAVFKSLRECSIRFDRFIALDLSAEMLALHPSGANIIKECVDFSSDELLGEFVGDKDTLLLSSSALQWSTDLDRTLSALSRCAKRACFAIFTSGTFKTLHQNAGITSPIYSEQEVRAAIGNYYDATFVLHSYQLRFQDTKEMFRYIQKSGVSGGERRLGYSKMKRLMEEYPLDYLEFEVLFVEATAI
ncbi:MAG: methyltransferase domain-containing protein [Campylobacterales bacterium]|nr:methyltransferase domain-containing protein [Campylobacterales bacterium]HEO98642.1 methyltransferase domain-containing protein [Campylobacterota bacterium]